MDLEPTLINRKSHELETSFLNNESDQSSSEDEEPYNFSSTSTSLIGLAIVFVMLGIPFLAVINERSEAKKSIIPTSLDQNGLKSSTSFAVSWVSKSSC